MMEVPIKRRGRVFQLAPLFESRGDAEAAKHYLEEWWEERQARLAGIDLKARKSETPPLRFQLVRDEDETGISGLGVVAYGVLFSDGAVVTRWNSDVAQTCVWASLEELEAVHGHGGRTRVEWIDSYDRSNERSRHGTGRPSGLTRGISG